MPSRGRLLLLGVGRHSRSFGAGSATPNLTAASDSEGCSEGEEDGTIDPNIWVEDFERAVERGSYHVKSNHSSGGGVPELDTFDISDSDDDIANDGYVNHMPLVSDAITRPYMVNQTIHADVAREGSLLDVVSRAQDEHVSLFDARRRRMCMSVDSSRRRDLHGQVIRYAPSGNESNGRSMARWITKSRTLLLARGNLKNLAEAEQIAIARGFFVRIVLKRWHSYAHKASNFRWIMMNFFASQSFKHWRTVAHHMTLALRFVGAITKAVYRQGFGKLNSHRLAGKALQIMMRCQGNTLQRLFRAWVKYLDYEAGEKRRCAEFHSMHVMRSCLKKWVFEVKVRKIFVKAMKRMKMMQMAPAFDRWRQISDWLAFEQKFWGTAVERAVKKAYLRWAGKRWLTYTLKRRVLRATMMKVLKKSQMGKLLWGWGRLRGKKEGKRRGEWKPRKLGFCTCVYALTHGGHCTCSFELHFYKRIQNFENVMSSSEGIRGDFVKQSRTFELDYEKGLDETVVGESLKLEGSLLAETVKYDLNGRRVREEKVRARRRKKEVEVGGKGEVRAPGKVGRGVSVFEDERKKKKKAAKRGVTLSDVDRYFNAARGLM